MGDTTLTVDEDVKNTLSANYRHDLHHSWTEFFEGVMEILPTVETIEDGCANCGETPFWNGPTENYGGVIQWFHTEFEGDDIYGTGYFCSPECAAERQEEIDAMVPEEPDLVAVGGHERMRTEFEGATFYIDGDARQVGIPIPGAFSGESSHGYEYDYLGEPVYLKNEGAWVQSGVIEKVFHEETHTTLDLGKSVTVEQLNHPDDEKREAFIETYSHWYSQECPECGEEIRVNEDMGDEIECPECETTVKRNPVHEQEIPDEILEYREKQLDD